MATDLEHKLIENMRNEIKGYIKMRGMTYDKVAKILTETYGEPVSPQSLSNKFARGSIKYIDVIKMAYVLGYNITWTQK